MLAKPTISPLVAQHIAELWDRWGVKPDLAETLWLIQLCDNVMNPGGARNLDLIGMPQQAGRSSTYLWPFTIGASVWFERCAVPWFEHSQTKYMIAEAFVLAHARNKVMLTAIGNRDVAEKAMQEWEATLDCTHAELQDAIDLLYPGVRKTTKKADSNKEFKASPDYEGLIAELETVTGIPADHWLWEMSMETTLQRVAHARRHHAAMSGQSMPNDDPLNDALQDLATGKKAIIDAHKKTEAAE